MACPIREFGQVAGDVLLAEGPVGGGDGGLDVAASAVLNHNLTPIISRLEGENPALCPAA
jgi:hypothetical protein